MFIFQRTQTYIKISQKRTNNHVSAHARKQIHAHTDGLPYRIVQPQKKSLFNI